MRDLEKMLQGLGEENKKAEQEESAMTLKNVGYKMQRENLSPSKREAGT